MDKGNYILFYVWDALKGRLLRKRNSISNRYKTLSEQNAYTKDRIRQINALLKEG